MPFPLVAALPYIAALATTAISHFSNRANAKKQDERNQEYVREQLAYNTPQSQMARFQSAGLNPHLIYGQGSPGNQNSPQQYPDIKPTDISSLMQILPVMNQTRLVDSQVQAQNAKTLQANALTEVAKMQKQVLEKNPLLDESGFNAIISSLKSTAISKFNEAKMSNLETGYWSGAPDERSAPIYLKLSKELQLLDQRFQLGTKDMSIKNEVLKSKEFQNAILDVQKKFMTDGEITPQHIVQFIQMLLLKLL